MKSDELEIANVRGRVQGVCSAFRILGQARAHSLAHSYLIVARIRTHSNIARTDLHDDRHRRGSHPYARPSPPTTRASRRRSAFLIVPIDDNEDSEGIQ